jgi:hypothetical protein
MEEVDILGFGLSELLGPFCFVVLDDWAIGLGSGDTGLWRRS